jgi:hypothetical protein
MQSRFWVDAVEKLIDNFGAPSTGRVKSSDFALLLVLKARFPLFFRLLVVR